MSGSTTIYLDYNASTPVADEVLEAMLPMLREGWGNPSSTHAEGRLARRAIETARAEVAALLGCGVDEVVFTSGGTESDNMALIGLAEARADRGRHVVTSSIEHPAVEESCRYLEERGFRVTRVGTDRDGRVDADALCAAVGEDTVVVSLVHAHGETGVLQPVASLRGRLPDHVALHTDAAQSVGKIDCDVDRLAVDALTVAGHKLYAPKGVGALYLRRGTACARFLHGGGHEGGRRAGTENTPAIVGLGAACRLARRETAERAATMAALRDRFEGRLRAAAPRLVVHGAAAERLPNTSFFALPGARAADVLAALPDLAIGSGSACHSGTDHVSSALRAMGVEPATAAATLRVCVGRATTGDEVDRAAERIAEAAAALRERA